MANNGTNRVHREFHENGASSGNSQTYGIASMLEKAFAPREAATSWHRNNLQVSSKGSFFNSVTRGMLAKYAHTVTSASLGAVTDADLKL